MTTENLAQAAFIVACVAFGFAFLLRISIVMTNRRNEELERTTRFVHWASTHERIRDGEHEVCGCCHCEQMRRDFGLQETWRWRKWSIPAKYT